MGAFFLYLTNHGWTWGTPLDWPPLTVKPRRLPLATTILAQVANVFVRRSRIGWFTNPLILWGILAELALFVLVAYTPVGNRLFGTSPLPLWIFSLLALGGMGLLLAEKGRKLLVNRLMRRPSPSAQGELSA